MVLFCCVRFATTLRDLLNVRCIKSRCLTCTTKNSRFFQLYTLLLYVFQATIFVSQAILVEEDPYGEGPVHILIYVEGGYSTLELYKKSRR